MRPVGVSASWPSVVAPQSWFPRRAPFADFHAQRRRRRQEHVHSRAELHDAEALARTHLAPGRDAADHPPREEADNLARTISWPP